jgi:hypothetical protein
MVMFGHRPDRAHICSERELLLGRVVVAEGPGFCAAPGLPEGLHVVAR